MQNTSRMESYEASARVNGEKNRNYSSFNTTQPSPDVSDVALSHQHVGTKTDITGPAPVHRKVVYSHLKSFSLLDYRKKALIVMTSACILIHIQQKMFFVVIHVESKRNLQKLFSIRGWTDFTKIKASEHRIILSLFIFYLFPTWHFQVCCSQFSLHSAICFNHPLKA